MSTDDGGRDDETSARTEAEIRAIVADELRAQQSNSTRRGVLKALGLGGAAAALGGTAGAQTGGGGGGGANLDVGAVTQNTYRIAGNRYGGPAAARSELNSELGSSDAGARFAADDTGAEYYWAGASWEQLPVEAPAINTEHIDNSPVEIGNSNTDGQVVNGKANIAIGDGASATADDTLAIGRDANATNNDELLIGHGAIGGGSRAVAIGDDALSAARAVSLGTLAGRSDQVNDEPTTSDISIGNRATASGAASRGSVAIGDDALALGSSRESIAIGGDAEATGDGAIAIGEVTTADDTFSIAIGRNTSATGTNSVAIGGGVSAPVNSSTRIANQVAMGAPDGSQFGNANLNNSELTFFLDETNGEIVAKIQESDGTNRDITVGSWTP